MLDTKKKAGIIAGIIAAILIIAGAAFALNSNNKQEEAQPETQTEIKAEEKTEEKTSDDPFWVLVIGNDTRTGTIEITKEEYADGNCRSDTMILTYVDPKQNKIALLTIPRDTAIQMDGKTTKFNAAYKNGDIDSLEAQVKELTGITPKYYVDTTFVGFEKIVDGLGGISANVPIPMSLQDIVSGENVSLGAGQQDLGGKEALVYVRQRKQYADDLDACRQIQDRAALQTMITKVASTPAIQSAAIDVLMANAKTNFTADELKTYVDMFSKNASSLQFVSGTGPYKGGIDAGADNQWIATREEATWKELIKTAESFGDLTSIVALPAVYAK